MKVLGLVVEYNPFHNGHLYHIQEAKRLSGADHVVCVMSGNFIQRGEPAIINKWARTKMALYCGIDLVIELPISHAMSSAESFSYGSVKILNDLGIIDYICFGSENGSIEDLDILSSVLTMEPLLYKALLKEELDRGLSFPASRENALLRYFSSDEYRLSKENTSLQWEHRLSSDDVGEILGCSNNILGIEYLKALKKLNSRIKPLTIKRISNSYNDENITGNISSATSIRKLLSEDSLHKALSCVLPETSYNIIKEEFEDGRGPVFLNNFSDIIISNIRKMHCDELLNYPYVSEGLHNRIKKAAQSCVQIDDLIDNICTKRYTRTRIQRILSSILTGITNDAEVYKKDPPYARILGFNTNGRMLLSKIKKVSVIPTINKISDFIHLPNYGDFLKKEVLSTDIYVLGYRNSSFKKGGQEYKENIVKV